MSFARLGVPLQQLGDWMAAGASAARGSGSESGRSSSWTTTLGRVAEGALDHGFTLSTHLLAGFPAIEQIRSALADARRAEDFYQACGWLHDPGAYHQTPPAPPPGELTQEVTWSGPTRQAYSRLSFESEFRPHPGEPGGKSWLALEANRTAHAYVLEHRGAPRPWLVCVHGFGMGSPLVSLSGFHVRELHHRLGLNLILPSLPLHGPRSGGRVSGGELLSTNYLRLVHLAAQGVWDVRRAVAWASRRSGRPVGIYGISLGAYVSSLVACLEPELACVVAGMPLVDFSQVARDQEPWLMRRVRGDLIDWNLIRNITRVVSPLAQRPAISRDRRFIYSGIADRIVKPQYTRQLWNHWDQPALHWYEGGHVLGSFNQTIGPFLVRSLEGIGHAH